MHSASAVFIALVLCSGFEAVWFNRRVYDKSSDALTLVQSLMHSGLIEGLWQK